VNTARDNLKSGWGWQVHIMPFLELGNLYNQLNVPFSHVLCSVPGAAANAAWPGLAQLQKSRIPVYMCPTADDPAVNPSRWPNVPAGNPNQEGHGKSNYTGVGGRSFTGIVTDPTSLDDGLQGIFIDPISITNPASATHSPISFVAKIDYIEDGTSNVFCVGEKFRRDTNTDFINQVAGPPTEYVGGYWVGIAPDTRAASCIMQLLPAPSSFAINGPSINAFASQHPGGAHFLLSDGTVRFVSQNMDQNAIANLATSNDGQVDVTP
jgi:hypothetical protein